MNNESSNANFTCPDCGENYPDAKSLQLHRSYEKYKHAEEAPVSAPPFHGSTDSAAQVAPSGPQSPAVNKLFHWNSTFVTILLLIFVTFSIYQAVQATMIWNKVGSQEFQPSAGSATNPSSSSLDNLPNMVGGC